MVTEGSGAEKNGRLFLGRLRVSRESLGQEVIFPPLIHLPTMLYYLARGMHQC